MKIQSIRMQSSITLFNVIQRIFLRQCKQPYSISPFIMFDLDSCLESSK